MKLTTNVLKKLIKEEFEKLQMPLKQVYKSDDEPVKAEREDFILDNAMKSELKSNGIDPSEVPLENMEINDLMPGTKVSVRYLRKGIEVNYTTNETRNALYRYQDNIEELINNSSDREHRMALRKKGSTVELFMDKLTSDKSSIEYADDLFGGR